MSARAATTGAAATVKSEPTVKEEKSSGAVDSDKDAAAESATASTDGAEAAASQEDDVCCVCFSGDIEDDNLIVYCDGTGPDDKPCTAIVHQFCYGVFNIPEGDDPWSDSRTAAGSHFRSVQPAKRSVPWAFNGTLFLIVASECARPPLFPLCAGTATCAW